MTHSELIYNYARHYQLVPIEQTTKAMSEKPPSTAQLTRLIRSMLRSLDLLGRDHMARVDARILAERYRKRAARIGVRKLL